MFKVEENLQLTRNAVVDNSYVVEDSKSFVPELEGFYVCLPKSRIAAIREYLAEQPNSTFVIKTFDEDPVNGLNLLLHLESKSSYTEEFVRYYGSVQGIKDAFAKFEKSDVTVNADTEEWGDKDEIPDDFIDDTILQNFSEPSEDTASENLTTDQASSDSAVFSDGVTNEDFAEMSLMLRGIAHKLGVIDYDDSSILTKADMRKAQQAINTLSTETMREAFLGALALAESKEDLVAVTRFLELFYTYVQENGLKR